MKATQILHAAEIEVLVNLYAVLATQAGGKPPEGSTLQEAFQTRVHESANRILAETAEKNQAIATALKTALQNYGVFPKDEEDEEDEE